LVRIAVEQLYLSLRRQYLNSDRGNAVGARSLNSGRPGRAI
jgi:hypothetical protein